MTSQDDDEHGKVTWGKDTWSTLREHDDTPTWEAEKLEKGNSSHLRSTTRQAHLPSPPSTHKTGGLEHLSKAKGCSSHIYVDAHLLATPAIGDIDSDGLDEIVIVVSYFFDQAYYDDEVGGVCKPSLPCRLASGPGAANDKLTLSRITSMSWMWNWILASTSHV